MAEKTSSYLSSVKEVNNDTNSISANKELNKKIIEVETQKAVKCALRKDYEQALDIFESIENREMVLVIKKCIELEPIFEQFLNGQISYGQYKKISKRFPEESKEIVQFKYPDLEFIEIQNLERKFREKIEGIIDELLAKNTLESLIEARKIYEKHMGIIKKPYNFDRLFIKTISFIPYSQLKPLYKIEWTDVEKLINEYLLNEANSFTKAEKILKEIKVIEANRDTIQIIIRNFNKQLDIKLRQNYRENKLRQFVREYKAHSFYQLERNNKITTKVEPYFLQRRIYAIYYVNENADLFLDMLKNQIDVLYAVPYENQRTYYHAIIRSLRIVRDYSIYDIFPEDILRNENFVSVMSDTLEEDEDTIRGIVKQLKGKENQEYMEYLFLNLFKKELSFVDTKKAPPFNKEKSEIQIQNYKENEHLAHQTKVKKALFKTLAAFELLASAIICLSLAGISFFAFRRHSYFLGVVLVIAGLILGIWLFVRIEEIISLKKERRLFHANKVINNLESENILLLKRIYLGLD